MYRRTSACFAYLMPTSCSLLLILLAFAPSFARQQTTDTVGYESQRRKVNELLAQRSERFGQFDESLRRRTGIFGLKTKKDMQASIDILKQIVLMDNDIFYETKTLLDYKEFEKSQIAEQASEYDGRINGYIKTISKLQQQQEELASQISALEKTNQLYEGLVILLGLTLLGGGAYVFIKRQKLTKT
ncbi:hypothetical protein JHJ32_12990 [Parapedobacter sp. ISTM3]|uniref:hypothetical protein n=1 Tax=Parapedobacter sp. ISTM3 TaxID=2800130 RepID=UPI00190901DF|nr:hypothetical protein [Parapedobacter sp. ISTM3]MBK1440909.1 hypothetical protein [Parapedobacter sp. ISTM3]